MALNYKSQQWDPLDTTNVTANLGGNVTISDSKGFIGLVSAVDSSYTFTRISSNTTTAALGAAGVFHSIAIGQISLPTTTIYDSTLPSGTVLLRLGVNYPLGVYRFDAKVANGVTVDTTAAGATPEITIMAK